jgi:hypothetical protein
MLLITENTQKKFNKWLLDTGWSAPLNTDEEKETAQLLKQLSYLSTFIFVFSFLSYRFIINAFTAILTWAQSLKFRYRLFDYSFNSVDGEKWPIEVIIYVFGLGYVVLTILGIVLAKKARHIHNVRWKIRLIMAWVAFLFVNSIPAAIIAGVFSMNSFGILFHWLVPDILIRFLIGLGALLTMYLSRNYWIFLFLKASPGSIFLSEDEPMRMYVQHVLCKSWLYGFLILLLFNWPLFDLFWPVFLLSLGFIARPFSRDNILHEDIYVRKSNKQVFAIKNSIYYLIGLLVLIRVAGSILILDL